MERLKTQATLTVGDDYAIFCRMFWDELDNKDAMLKIFKPTWEQKSSRLLSETFGRSHKK